MPVISAADFTALLRAHDFARLFDEYLGWDNVPRNTPNVQLDAPGAAGPEPFVFRPVKVKHGFMVLSCPALPTKAQRQRLSLQMSQRYAEHLLVYAPAGTGEAGQLWQLVTRDPGEPVRFFEFPTNTAAQRENLRRRVEGLYIDFEEEAAGLTLTQVREKNRRAFALNAEKVTKKFYAEFSRQHQAFQGLLAGIEGSSDRAWYTSIMLNRIMFIYFVQAQGYLLVKASGPSEHDKDYLDFKRKQCAELVGKNQFHSFYRSFLRVLFQEGLNAPLPHDAALTKLLGRVPYLNGGLFEEHELERAYPAISIPDKAFENLFEFLGKWDWILDSRHQANGTTINPDVIGYIFERYINERAQMGAYYTKEDITEYIAKNCLIPALFDRMAERGARHESEVWDLLQDYPDRYLYPAQRKGIDRTLPDEIEAGRTDKAARATHWNRPTPEEYGLPTEIWRETIQRRDRATTARARLLSGQVRSINELITLNLDLRQFLHDAVANAGNAEWVWACFESLRSLSILDPTCGSGAFLFAALRLLEPLYQECLDRMEAFLPELENPKALRVKKEVVKGMQQVRRELVENHLGNRAYFVTKTIILHNLYGVDLMHEAVEIAKLRLFLQLMSTLEAPDYADANLGLEPLPDVDFNIRAGNTLVGFATRAELDSYAKFDFDKVIPEIEAASEALAGTYDDFRELQLTDEAEQAELKEAKQKLREAAAEVADKANGLLRIMDMKLAKKTFIDLYQPFHWHLEFHEIVDQKGGFDIIIGNPPYVEITPRTVKYKLTGYATLSCGNLYALVTERANTILAKNGRLGFIVPSASCCTPRMEPLIRLFTNQFSETWLSIYDERPGKLFDGVDQQLCIQITTKQAENKALHITGMRHWQTPSAQVSERDSLFATVPYLQIPTTRRIAEVFPKLSQSIEESILKKLADCKTVKLSSLQMTSPQGTIYYRNAGGRYWRLVKSFPSYFNSDSGRATSSTELTLNVAKQDVSGVVCLFSSSLFYWYWRVVSNCRHLTNREIGNFPIPEALITDESRKTLKKLASRYEKRISETANRIIVDGNSGRVEQDEYHVNQAKSIIDEIDEVLAVHYGFTDEELDFIINYDIKYRMGAELNAD